MRKLNWLIAVFAISMLQSGIAMAANTCEQNKFSFIYDKSFVTGDGEGMEDHACKESNFRHGDEAYQKVKALADAGKYQQAERAVYSFRATPETSKWSPDMEVCVRPSLEKPLRALVEDVVKHDADAAEKAGRLAESIRIHDEYCHFAEAARVHVVRVKGATFRDGGFNPNDSNDREYKDAYAYNRAHPFDNLRKALREVASDRVEQHRKIEEKRFTAGPPKGSFMPGFYVPENLEHALDWLPYAGDDGSQKKAIMAFAEKRGDTIFPQEGCQNLDSTIAYYKISGNQAKVKQATARGVSVGELYEKRGAYPAAAKCYEAAGDRDKAAHIEEVAGAQREQKAAEYEKSEKVRQKKFSKEQDDLEKELGF